MAAHQVALQGAHVDGRPHLLVACRGVGDPFAPIVHHVGSPDVKGGAVGGAGRAVVVSHVLVELADGRRRASLAIHVGAAGIAHAEVRVCGKVWLFLFILLLLLFLIRVIFLAAIVLHEREGVALGEAEQLDLS